MKTWSLKIKVGIYAALLTMAALVAGALVMMTTLYLYQISELDNALHDQVRELVWDLRNFRDSPKDPTTPIDARFIPVALREHYLSIENADGLILYRSANLSGKTLNSQIGRSRTERLDGELCRVGRWKEGFYVVSIAARLNLIRRFQRDLGIGFVTALPAVGLIVFFGGLWLGRRAVAPVAKLGAAAERISASTPQERLPMPPARDEIATLTEVLNRSFDRLQASYEIATRFSADASHQMMTPVAILRAGLDHLSNDTDLNESQAAEVAMLRQQTRRLKSLIDDLLLLAQADAGRVALETAEIDLCGLLRSACDDLAALVEDKDIRIEEKLPKSLTVHADSRLVAIVIQNLVENAAKYTPDHGIIRLTAFSRSNWQVVQLSNTGQEIPQAEQERIFERFSRGSSVGGNIRGHGLGLNIAKELLVAHGGDLRLIPLESGWIGFEFRLPKSLL